ncbi:hypothetical protein NESM_000093800 [Novymonas esmeraldas]|uniref:Uncharacterized protein n=1 Tax=Novymonas esmeraldas TaxID=1808958 RepID=A0AAW0F5E2_9TRYP
MRCSAVRRQSVFQSRGAAGDWFGRQSSAATWRGALTSFVACMCGIAVVNQFCRGNPMGRCEYESDIVMALPRTKVPPPDTSGFVDATSASGRDAPPPPPATRRH